MRITSQGKGFSATDLSAFLECTHRTALDLLVLEGRLERPGQNEIERRLLEMRGAEHERRVLEHYESSGKSVVAIPFEPGAEAARRAAERTLEAMSAGADVIYQAALAHGAWSGRPDFLVKVGGGTRWAHHYEVVDAKLSREAKARAVLQLCVYTDHLTRIQEHAPENFYVAASGSEAKPLPLRVEDYMSYYRAIRARFEDFVGDEGAMSPYPEPVEHCAVCPWWKRCEDRRRSDDHLSLVAGITRRQRDRLASSGVARVVDLAALSEAKTVEGVAADSLGRLRQQARLQVAGRSAGKVIHELLLDFEPGTGLEALPRPTPGDLFFDLEGDSFVGGEGLEYLFGFVDFGEPDDDFLVREAPGQPRYFADWASDKAGEKRAFERIVDRIVKGREEFAELHVYHFGHRESDALKKLSCRHKTREEEVDQLLRDHVLVDLYPIVRQSLRASLEGYTLKQLEALHGFGRNTDLRAAAQAMHLFVWWLETADAAVDAKDLRERIQSYNEDDCLSTARLRDFLEQCRLELERQTSKKLTRPDHQATPANEERTSKSDATAALAKRLLAGNADPARLLMADLLDWHWREAKSGWWDYHRARELAAEDRLEDRAVLAGLTYEGVVGKIKLSEVHRYRFAEQEHGVRAKPTPIDPDTGKPAGTVVEIRESHIDLKRKSAVAHPRALIPGKPIVTHAHEQSLLAIGQALADGSGEYPAALALLSRSSPLVGQEPGQSLVRSGEPIAQALARLALALDGSVLAVQGPPGSGKTHQAALMIGELYRAGKRVGVTGNSHAVIKNLLGKVVALAGDAPVRALHLQDDDSDDAERVQFQLDNDKPRAARALAAGELNVVGGTSWTWADEKFESSVDLLVIDEAGQMSLANVLAVSRAARSLVLFGDPAQLEQPQKGVHPPGAELSALEHLLGSDDSTIAPERGVFIPQTRRLHPDVCAFISTVFYGGRLAPDASLGLEKQRLHGPGVFGGTGLRYVPVSHRGNTNHSSEEVEAIRALVAELFASAATFTDNTGKERALTMDDVLVVAPYNAQVAALRRALPPEIRVGTVDKFQGREAPVVIYSMTTSTAEDAPRGLEFLYSLNRLNVAISRAQAIAVLVASPELARVSCRTPRQMKLVNALCRYLEMQRQEG